MVQVMSRKNILIRYFYLNVENLSYSLYLSLISVKTMTEKDQKLSMMKNRNEDAGRWENWDKTKDQKKNPN